MNVWNYKSNKQFFVVMYLLKLKLNENFLFGNFKCEIVELAIKAGSQNINYFIVCKYAS